MCHASKFASKLPVGASLAAWCFISLAIFRKIPGSSGIIAGLFVVKISFELMTSQVVESETSRRAWQYGAQALRFHAQILGSLCRRKSPIRRVQNLTFSRCLIFTPPPLALLSRNVNDYSRPPGARVIMKYLEAPIVVVLAPSKHDADFAPAYFLPCVALDYVLREWLPVPNLYGYFRACAL